MCVIQIYSFLNFFLYFSSISLYLMVLYVRFIVKAFRNEQNIYLRIILLWNFELKLPAYS